MVCILFVLPNMFRYNCFELFFHIYDAELILNFSILDGKGVFGIQIGCNLV